MATPAAAALFAAALPRTPESSEASTSTNHPNSRGNQRGRGSRGSSMGRQRGGRGSRGDDDMGVSGEGKEGFRRKGKEGRKSNGPMGERPSGDLRSRISGPTRNSPGVLRDDDRRPRGNINAAAPPSGAAIQTLRLFLLSRYSEADKMLNLENMAGDALLIEAGLKAPGEKGAPANVANAMWKLAGSLFPDIVSLSLAHNNLSSLQQISPFLLTSFLPNILNVSLAGNRLDLLRDIDPVSPVGGAKSKDKRPRGWAKLQELVLTGNPLVESGVRENAYRSEVSRRFPSLRQLDQKPLDPSIAFASSSNSGPSGSAMRTKENGKGKSKARTPVVFPVSVNAGFFESEGTRDFVAGFFMKFFPAFDTDRPSLLPAYSPTCSFSFHADTAPPSRARAKKIGSHSDKKHPNQRKLDWKLYLTMEGSRNLARVKLPEKRVATLQITPSTTISSLCKLPETVHPLTDPTKFVFDTWTMPGLLAPTAPGVEGETVILAIVHGEFTELPSKGLRSFDRTFILAPAPVGSPAQVAGWPCIILSDIMSLRAYSDPIAWAPTVVEPPVAGPSTLPGVPALPAPIVERAEGLTDPQQSLILELCARTKLTYSFSHLCLMQNDWVPERALENFATLNAAGRLPAEAFQY